MYVDLLINQNGFYNRSKSRSSFYDATDKFLNAMSTFALLFTRETERILSATTKTRSSTSSTLTAERGLRLKLIKLCRIFFDNFEAFSINFTGLFGHE